MHNNRDLESKSINFIIGTGRAMVVIDGQPFYRSTGFNSSGYNLLLSSPPEKLVEQTLYFTIVNDALRGTFLKYSLLSLQGEKVSGLINELPGCNLEKLAALEREENIIKAQYKILHGDEYEEFFIKDYGNECGAEYELQGFLPEILKNTYAKGYTHSSAKDRWEPFVMMAGTQEAFSLDSLPAIYNKGSKHLLEDIATSFDYYIIKPFDYLTEDVKHKEGVKENKHFSSLQAQRIPLQSQLIISSCLDTQHYTTEQLLNAGLTEQEVAKALTPIHLAKKPQFSSDDGDKINEWLGQNGASYIDGIFLPKRTAKISTPTTTFTSLVELSPIAGTLFFHHPSFYSITHESNTSPPVAEKDNKRQDPSQKSEGLRWR